jgi:hypothetical protein
MFLVYFLEENLNNFLTRESSKSYLHWYHEIQLAAWLTNKVKLNKEYNMFKRYVLMFNNITTIVCAVTSK